MTDFDKVVECDPMTYSFVKRLYEGGSPVPKIMLERCGIEPITVPDIEASGAEAMLDMYDHEAGTLQQHGEAVNISSEYL